jgi:hypothetical protein
MSQVGKTLLRGHGLEGEGNRRFERDGITESRDGSGSGRCSCGALSEPGISTKAIKRWHREHKDSLR